MRDKVGKELEVGDRVVFSDSNYADLNEGTVDGFTPKMVRIRRSSGTVLKTRSQVAIVEKFNG